MYSRLLIVLVVVVGDDVAVVVVEDLQLCLKNCAAGLTNLLENKAQLKIRSHLFLFLLLSSLKLYIVIITW